MEQDINRISSEDRKAKVKHSKGFFPLIYGQCTEFLHAKLEGLENWEITSDTFDVLALIRAIKGLS